MLRVILGRCMQRRRLAILGVSALLIMLSACASRDPHEILASQAIPPSWQIHADKSSFDIAPKFLSGSAPLYPISQLQQHKSGTATISFTIDAQGKPRDVGVVAASYPFFGSHAVLAVQDWRFEPAQKNGHPARMHVTFNYYVP